MNYIGRAIALGLVSCFMMGQLYAQKKKVSQEEQLSQAKLLYESYRFAEAGELLDRLMSSRRGMSPALEAEAGRLIARTERAERMLVNVEQVSLIDSIHIAKAELGDFVLRLPDRLRRSLRISEAGDVVSGAYRLEALGKEFQSREVGGDRDLFCSDLIGSVDTLPQDAIALGSPINSPEDEISPFVLPDGERLIFARASAGGLGGYDLYWSRFNADKQMYYEPLPLGMPFNSPYNDYMLVYDDETNESWLVSDRFCPSDSLVVYRLGGLPRALEGGALSEESLKEAEPTEDVELLRHRALFRVDLVRREHKASYDQEGIYLPLRDGVVLRSWSDFHDAQAMNLYQDYVSGHLQLQGLKDQLQIAMKAYLEAKAMGGDIASRGVSLTELRGEIEALELRLSRLLKEVKNLEISQRF